MVGAHFQLDAAVEIAIQRAVGAAPRAGAGDRVDLNLAAGGVIFQRAFRRGAEQGEIIVLHKEHVRAWVALFQHIISGQRRRAGQREATGRHDLENFPARIARCIWRTTAPYSSSLWSTSQRISATVVTGSGAGGSFSC
jgi:hypothetical protein